MILCGDKKARKGDREGEGADSPSGQTLGGMWKWRSWNKKHSYATISDGAWVQRVPCPRLEHRHLTIQTHLTVWWPGKQQQVMFLSWVGNKNSYILDIVT